MLSRCSLFDCLLVWACVLLFNYASTNLSIVNAFVRHHPSTCSKVTVFKASSSHASISNKSIVVISPEGGLGEITAVEAAKLGASVKWFIIHPSTTQASSIRVNFNAPTLASFTESGGSIQFASSDATSILLPQLEDSIAVSNANALEALCSWAGNSFDGLICTWDHPLFTNKEDITEDKETESNTNNNKKQETQEEREFIDAIKVAVQKVSSTNSKRGIMRVAILPSLTKMNLYEAVSPSVNTKGDSPFAFFSQNNQLTKINIPSTIQKAISVDGTYPVATLRYGSLFGTPSSSVC